MVHKKVYKSIFSNIIFQYTIISLFVTFTIAYFLIGNMIKISQDHSVILHSKFYVDFIQSIPRNYPGLAEILIDGSHKVPHEESEEDSPEHDFEHFKKDFILFPELTQINMYSSKKSLIWEYRKIEHDSNPHKQYMLNKALEGYPEFHIQRESGLTILHSYLPIFKKDMVIGVVEITDVDENFSIYLRQSRQVIITNIIIGGSIFYFLLFILFYRAYSSQNKALNRLDKSQRLTIHSMSLLAELRDQDTGSHIIRTREYCRILAEELQKRKEYNKYLSLEYIEDLERSAPLHDIGKVGIPDNILLKPGKLTDEEFNIIKNHTLLGAEVLSSAAKSLDFQSYFQIGIQVVKHHHENWDGSGYPDGLTGDTIPLSARIMAIADVYDALRSNRPYKKPYSHKKAKEIIIAESGKKFDPDIVEAFINIESYFEKISR